MNIIIIGGTHGIGKEVVNYLAQDADNQILVTGRDENALKSLSVQFNNVRAFT